jgi:hypothetical protein
MTHPRFALALVPSWRLDCWRRCWHCAGIAPALRAGIVAGGHVSRLECAGRRRALRVTIEQDAGCGGEVAGVRRFQRLCRPLERRHLERVAPRFGWYGHGAVSIGRELDVLVGLPPNSGAWVGRALWARRLKVGMTRCQSHQSKPAATICGNRLSALARSSFAPRSAMASLCNSPSS